MRYFHWLLLIAVIFFSACTQDQQKGREVLDFNKNWRFHLGEDSLASGVNYEDSLWTKIDVPHDWSIEGPFEKDAPSTTAEAALPTGIGWYRKDFVLPHKYEGKSVFIKFGGIFRDSKVWVNGHFLGERPNGHVSFEYELTPYLHFDGQKNVIAVKVDNSLQPNSRWYTGSGIYRNVRLVVANKIKVAHSGVFITTPEVDSHSANVDIEVSISSKVEKGEPVNIETKIFSLSGKKVAKIKSSDIMLEDSLTRIVQHLKVSNPRLWSVLHPNLYYAEISIKSQGTLVDRYKQVFGIRSFHFDKEKGFYLNGEQMPIRGVCLHEDLGELGVAVNESAIIRRLKLLKEMGCNAIRTAHNPPSAVLLNLCDQMGFLVMDEAFDVWKKKKVKYDYHIYWDEWHKRDLEDMVKRDRNHPSVIMWSIGNEIRAQFDSSGIPITKELVSIVKSLDQTRPVTCALTEMDPDKNFIYQSNSLDILGFNYNDKLYSDIPKLFPDRKYIGTETTAALETRGQYDMPSDSIMRWPESYKAPFKGNPDYTVSAYDNISAYWGSTHEETLKSLKRSPYMTGIFVWTGIDYLGEPLPYPWPARSSYFGIIDLAGFPKDAYYLYQSLWTDKPVLHIFPHWNWEKGKTVDVWAYYNHADEVELFLNGKSLGTRKKEGEELHVMWRVKYEPGTLKAVSRKDGKTVLVKEIHTAGTPAKIELLADRKKIKADGIDISFVTARILDKEGNLVPDADNLIRFSVNNKGKIAGTNNGYQADLESFKAHDHKAFNGLCLVDVQSREKPGEILLKASAEGLQADSIFIQSR